MLFLPFHTWCLEEISSYLKVIKILLNPSLCFNVLFFTFRSIIWNLFLCLGEVMFKCKFFFKSLPNQLAHLMKILLPMALQIPSLFKRSVHNCVGLFSGFLLCSVNLLVHLAPIPYSINYCSFIISTWCNNFPTYFSFYNITTLCFHINF